ncbi:uncharacterized protein LOC119437798 [Dermacentor silvarum]|uniref:uncharacterized protein LOC119437798 n=1 Tax=Dermacentor silvarum TaxID=543639 RepID=UPI00189B982B|nr:uncharacterized protein LOC119437798 [Dermacentor silvarum]
MCFSIDSPDSLENYPESGMLEVRHFCRSVPTILAGTEGPVHAVGACQDESEVTGGPPPLGAGVAGGTARSSGSSADDCIDGLNSLKLSNIDHDTENREPSQPKESSPRLSKRGGHDYDWLRPLSYSDTAVILMRFSIDSPDSLANHPESGTLEGPKYPYTLSEFAKANQRWQEDHDRLRPVSYPHVLQHRLTRLPGEPPGVGHA